MATMALPFSELAPVIVEAERAQADTRCVVSCSGSTVADFSTVWQVFQKTISLKFRFAHLVNRQARLIEKLLVREFSDISAGELRCLASKIDELLADERDLLKNAETLGVQIRVWWASSLLKLADQVEHLDSISESLHLAADPEGTALMAIAAEQLVAAKEFALQ